MLYITQSDLERLKLKRWAMVCWANGNRENRDGNPEIENNSKNTFNAKSQNSPRINNSYEYLHQVTQQPCL